MKEVFSWLLSFAAALAIVFLIRTFLFTTLGVKGQSMINTLQHGDRVYVSRLLTAISGYQRGDIVICTYPGADHRCIKRLIGLPGDTVEIKKGVVSVNGEALEEDYVDFHASYSCEPVTLGAGEYYVMGDNRPISHDSHSADVGPVTRMEGKVRFIYWPVNRIGAVK